MSKAERTKQFIIEKTAPIFNAKGYAGTSLNDMIFATGLTKGSIYGNFENKDEVAVAAFDHTIQKVFLLLKNRVNEKNTIIEKLLVYPETYSNFFDIPFLSSGCPILNTATEVDDTHPLLRKKVNEVISFWKKTLTLLIKHGIETNELKQDINIEEFVIILVSLIEGGVMQAKISGQILPLRITMKHLEKLIMDLKS